MSDYPDLIRYGYQVETELGRNREGGRITWKARVLDIASRSAIETATTVAIKQFCFAQANSSWSGYRAYSQEIAMLQNLNHPGIPQYLKSIETDDGFCLVQEYVLATPCSNFRSLNVAEVKEIADKILDILIYLQQQKPPILHRDLSTDNVLLSESLDVYLIDFGFSSLENQSISGSSLFQGTPGFIAPEQIIKPIKASDIYSLGVVLVCLLSDRNITEVSSFTDPDNPYQLDLEQLLPDLDPEFHAWLAKMTSAKVSQRFADALSAKQALKELDSALTWLENSADASLVEDSNLSHLKPKLMGIVGITSVTAIATWGLNFAISRVELTFLTVTIAILATVAIAITQLGAATIANDDAQAKIQGIVLSTIIPILLVSASGLIWGMGEAIIISAAIAVAEVGLISYYWGQLPMKNPNQFVKSSLWLSAIAIGITCGLYI